MASKWAGFDAIYWSSAIFSRQAMAMNHVRPHKYVDRRGFGCFRMLAGSIMMTLYVFLTIYETMMNKQRVCLTFVWWVSLFTWFFFACTKTHWRAYFDEKRP